MPDWHPWATLRIQDGRQDGGGIIEMLYVSHLFLGNVTFLSWNSFLLSVNH